MKICDFVGQSPQLGSACETTRYLSFRRIVNRYSRKVFNNSKRVGRVIISKVTGIEAYIRKEKSITNGSIAQIKILYLPLVDITRAARGFKYVNRRRSDAIGNGRACAIAVNNAGKLRAFVCIVAERRA